MFTTTLLLLTACSGRGGAKDSESTADTAGDCDPTIASIELPDFHAELDVTVFEIDPAEIDPESDNFPASHHRIWIPSDMSQVTREELFVIIPGTGNQPNAFDDIANVAVRSGYAVIGLAWDSEYHVADYCTESSDQEACREAVFEEKAYGNNTSEEADISEADSVVGRLTRLLRHLDTNYPDAGAGAFLDGDTPRWGSMVLTGFSQGASMVGYVSKDVEVARAVLLAGGGDSATTDDGEILIADWCYDPRATPASRTFALSHLGDSPEADAAVHAAYGLLDIADYVDAGTSSPAYCTATHALTFDLPAAGDNPNQGHLATAHDGYVPVDDDGVPLLAEDYHYLFTAE